MHKHCIRNMECFTDIKSDILQTTPFCSKCKEWNFYHQNIFPQKMDISRLISAVVFFAKHVHTKVSSGTAKLGPGKVISIHFKILGGMDGPPQTSGKIELLWSKRFPNDSKPEHKHTIWANASHKEKGIFWNQPTRYSNVSRFSSILKLNLWHTRLTVPDPDQKRQDPCLTQG